MYRNHLALPSEAESHFRAVCRALVSEALELSSFMEKVRVPTNCLFFIFGAVILLTQRSVPKMARILA